MLRTLYSFTGGVKPDYRKEQSTALPIAVAPLPSVFVVPLHQHIGGTPRPLVKVGRKVLKGERIGAADGNFSSAVHAPTSGTVTAIEPRLMAHASGLSAPAVVIEPDGEERWIDLEPMDYRRADPGEVRDYLRDAGVVGLGGAVFPSHLKLTPGKDKPTRTLVLNGAECEPYITCDDLLMREHPDLIIKGGAIMRHLLQAQEVLIGDLEDLEARAQGCDLLVTHSHGRQLAERLDLPFLRMGIPMFDRLGAAHQVTVGYRGMRDLVFEIANLFMAEAHEPGPDDWRQPAPEGAACGSCASAAAH